MIEYENLGKINQLFFEEYNNVFQEVVKSGWYILGEKVRQFEQEFSKYCDTHFCCGTANCLDSLILSLKAFQFEPGDEVIVPSNTYIATILAIVHNGLKPILVEPDIQTYNMDANRIEEKEKDKIRNGTVLVLNALRKEKHISHFTLDEATELALSLNNEQTYITHISHQLGKHENINRELPKGVALAHDNLVLEL